MTLRHEILISLFSVFVIFLVFNPLTIFLQDLAHGHMYFKYQFKGDMVILTLVNTGMSYLKDIDYNATVKDLNGNTVTKTGHIDIFQKGDSIDIIIPWKVPNTIPTSVYLKLAATINGLYRFNFEVSRG